MFDIESYERGAEDMLEVIRSIFHFEQVGGMPCGYLREHFGYALYQILDSYTALELIGKYKSYKDKSLEEK